MNQKSATRTIDIKVPVSPGGRHTTGKPKSKTSKRSRKSRGARQSRAASAQDMRDYYYSASLVDPWGTLGSKIPDAVTTASFTTHSVIRGTFPASTLLAGSGFANGALLDIKPGVALTGNSVLFPVSPGSLPDMIRFGAPSKPIPNAGGLNTNASAIRVVSAGLAITYTGSLLNTQGTIIAGFLPRGSSPAFNASNDYSLTTFLNKPHIKQCTVQYGKPCSVTWTPPEISQNFYRFSSDTDGLGQLFVVAFGLNGTGSSFDISTVINWEALPNENAQGLIPVTTSSCSFRAMEIAANVLATRSMFHAPINDIQNATSNQESVIDDGGTTTAYVMDRVIGFRQDILEPLSRGFATAKSTVDMARYAAQGYARLRDTLFAPGGLSGAPALGYGLT